MPPILTRRRIVRKRLRPFSAMRDGKTKAMARYRRKRFGMISHCMTAAVRKRVRSQKKTREAVSGRVRVLAKR